MKDHPDGRKRGFAKRSRVMGTRPKLIAKEYYFTEGGANLKLWHSVQQKFSKASKRTFTILLFKTRVGNVGWQFPWKTYKIMPENGECISLKVNPIKPLILYSSSNPAVTEGRWRTKSRFTESSCSVSESKLQLEAQHRQFYAKHFLQSEVVISTKCMQVFTKKTWNRNNNFPPENTKL